MVFLRSVIRPDHPSIEILGDERMGTAVVIGTHRILTAHYIVIGASEVDVVDGAGRHHGLRKLHVDHASGLALLTVDGPDLEPATLGVDEAAAGLPVFLLAAVGERERKGATGIVTEVGPFETYWESMLDGAILSTCANPGLAGAPLLDGAGHVLGLVTLGLLSAGRASMAVPVSLYWRQREVLDGLSAPPREPAWLGLFVQSPSGGIVVTGLVSEGPAAAAGLRRGDVILSVEGEEVATLRAFYAAVQKRDPGQTLDLAILRDEALLLVAVTAGDRTAFFA